MPRRRGTPATTPLALLVEPEALGRGARDGRRRRRRGRVDARVDLIERSGRRDRRRRVAVYMTSPVSGAMTCSVVGREALGDELVRREGTPSHDDDLLLVGASSPSPRQSVTITMGGVSTFHCNARLALRADASVVSRARRNAPPSGPTSIGAPRIVVDLVGIARPSGSAPAFGTDGVVDDGGV